MINKLLFLDTSETYPYRNLAVEEYLTLNVEDDTCILYLWQNRHTVVVGRNQNLRKECNVEEAEKDGVFLVRRLSGGGAVFHDMGNLNFTFIVRKADYDVAKQTQVILNALESLGIKAERSGRNDVTVEGAKISGNAFYRKHGNCYHHGTLLIDTDKNKIGKYLNVSKEKLALKGVDSVRARVGNLIDYKADISVSEVKNALRHAFSDVYGLPVEDMTAYELRQDDIEAYAERFMSKDWIYGSSRFYDHTEGRRFEWGDIEFYYNVRNGIIEDLHIYSDAMEQDYIMRLRNGLEGCEYSQDRIAGVIDSMMASEDDVTELPIERIGSDIKAMTGSWDFQ